MTEGDDGGWKQGEQERERGKREWRAERGEKREERERRVAFKDSGNNVDGDGNVEMEISRQPELKRKASIR